MPVEWRLHVLEDRLRRDVGGRFSVESVDLYGLTSLEQSAAIDALVETQGAFPVTLVNGVVACVGDIDIDPIVTAARLAKKE